MLHGANRYATLLSVKGTAPVLETKATSGVVPARPVASPCSPPRKADADRLLGEHRQYLRVRAARQVEVLDPYPVRTRRRRLHAVLTLAGMYPLGWGAVVVVATFG